MLDIVERKIRIFEIYHYTREGSLKKKYIHKQKWNVGKIKVGRNEISSEKISWIWQYSLKIRELSQEDKILKTK